MTRVSFATKLLGRYIDTGRLFTLCIIFSLAVHASVGSIYIYNALFSKPQDDVFINTLFDLDFEEIEVVIPPRTISSTTRPAPVEKQEWVEGEKKTGEDPIVEDVNINRISQDGTDKDGFLFSFHGDRPPTPIIDFDLRQYFPREAKLAEIREYTVTMLVQIDENGRLVSAQVASGRAMYGFNEAAIAVTNRMRFSPGYKAGKRVKMAHYMPIRFILER